MHQEYHNRKLPTAANLGEALLSEHNNRPEPTQAFADDLFNLAIIYDEMNHLERAAVLYSESCAHLDYNDFAGLAKRSGNLAGVLARMGALEPAFHFFYQTMHIFERFLGTSHPSYADSLYNLANLSATASLTEDAVKLHIEALEIREKMGISSDIVHSLHSLAFIHEEKGDYKKATSYAETALNSASTDDYASACSYLAELYVNTHEHKKALALYDDLLEQLTKFGCTHADYLSVLCHKAFLKGTTGKMVLDDISALIRLHLDSENYDKAVAMLVYALASVDHTIDNAAIKTIDHLTDVLATAKDNKKLLAAMKEINDPKKIQSMLKMRRPGKG